MLHWILVIIDAVFFILMALSVAYLLIFSLASLKKRKKKYPVVSPSQRFVVMFPAYKEDNVIIDSVKSILDQDYPKELYDVVVISDKMKEETNKALAEYPIILLEVKFQSSSKAKALNFAIDELKGRQYDSIVILDADNTVEKDFLSQINNVRSTGQIAIQAHRRAKNLNTDTAMLDAVSEEVNNTIFRAGHVQLGFPSALIGSGMAFEYQWFAKNIKGVHTAGEDKEIEALLLKQNIYVEYLEDVYVYDEKVQRQEVFKNQRRRWLAAQFRTFAEMFSYLPKAIGKKNWGYCDKIIQMLMLPRAIVAVIIILFFAVALLLDYHYAIKWGALIVLLTIIFFISIPNYLMGHKLYKTLWKIPIFGVIMILNLFHLRGASEKFIHTEHGN